MDLLFLSQRIYLGDGSHETPLNGGIIVDTGGIIRRVLRTKQEVNTYLYNTESEAVYDFGDLVLMPGLIDTNVHINEPGGRTDWEGFASATKAAAAGGFTTIINRPTNATPPTVSVQTLKAKASTACGKIYVDVGFWGGLVPGNMEQLGPQLAAGVVGLQCTLCNSAQPVGEEFAAINESQLAEALQQLNKEQATDALIAFHAELPATESLQLPDEAASKCYSSFLRSRPTSMELSAVELICRAAATQPQHRYHIMNLSCAEALPMLETCRRQTGVQLSAETCPHYLALAAEQVPDCGTEFKTWPPIREQANQAALWSALRQPDSTLQLIASDHSSATPGARCLTYGRGRGNFMNAWPGISSLQLSLPVVWTRAKQTEQPLSLAEVHRLMCWQPAQLCGLARFKGCIAEGYDADFCIWNPDEEFTVSGDQLYASHKSPTPYAGQRLSGVVHATVVRGLHVYQQYEGFGQPLGKVLLRKSSAKLVKFVRL
ncbi:uncharacterized protein LOC111593045 isoform X2 [Drosophila hydei]|uniref:allantoinase n=2 Tax=Drosophila hydei TaxID=7224 RepID=A0A6J1LAW1_DROHY|nr:uncharacterized protein LOC111593045 isoform X2 [Drosophila hydei]